MSARAHPIQEYLLAHAARHPHDLVLITAKHFRVTQQAVQRHVAALIKDGLLRKEGRTRNVRYMAGPLAPRTNELNGFNSKNETQNFHFGEAQFEGEWDEQKIWDHTLKDKFQQIPENVRGIFEYGFTEMVNNVRDHSGAQSLDISHGSDGSFAEVTIHDDGIGIFRKIQNALKLPYAREAILHLSKGKFTTDAARHSGEGIFFTSRVFDEFSLCANGLIYERFNSGTEEDWLIGSDDQSSKGTCVRLKLALNSPRTLEQIFRKYAPYEDFSFSKTHVAVELGLNPDETYISRSQAKRILDGLEKFKFITLDFRRVKMVGQGFVDQVFRVFKNEHPHIQLNYVHANEDVEFMIKRT